MDDWAVRHGLFVPSAPAHRTPSFIGGFSSSDQERRYYRGGQLTACRVVATVPQAIIRAETSFGPTRFGGSSSVMIGSASLHSASGIRQIGGKGSRSFFRATDKRQVTEQK